MIRFTRGEDAAMDAAPMWVLVLQRNVGGVFDPFYGRVDGGRWESELAWTTPVVELGHRGVLAEFAAACGLGRDQRVVIWRNDATGPLAETYGPVERSTPPQGR